MQTRLEIVDVGFLDLYENIVIPLNLRISEISDISKRGGGFSKTITLRGTKKNNQFFGNLFDVSSDFTLFNPNRKVRVRVWANDSNLLLDGFLQLRKINVNRESDDEGNRVNYQVVVYDEVTDFYNELKEKTLNDINLAELNHTWNWENIEESFNNTWEDGYKYFPYFKETGNIYFTTDFYPSLFQKWLFTKVLQSQGYSWSGSFRDDERFSKEIFAYCKDLPLVEASTLQSRRFRVSLTGSQPTLSGIENAGNISASGGASSEVSIYSQHTQSGDLTFPVNIPESIVDNTKTKKLYKLNNWDDSTTINFNNGQWDNSSSSYKPTYTSANVDFLFRNRFKFSIENNSGADLTTWNFGGGLHPKFDNTNHQVIVKVYLYDATSTSIIAEKAIPVINQSDVIEIDDNTTFEVEADIEALFQNIFVNDTRELELYYSVEMLNMTLYAGTTAVVTGGVTYQSEFVNTAPSDSNLFTPLLDEKLQELDEFNLNQITDDQINLSDYVRDIIQRYNLFVTVNPDNKNELILDTKDKFYAQGDIVDWDNKADNDTIDEITPVAFLQNREFELTFKEGDDYFNENWQDRGRPIFGRLLTLFENDFTKGRKTIESIYTPCQIMTNPQNNTFYTPAIYANEPERKQTIFLDGGLKDYEITNNNFRIVLFTLDSSGNLQPTFLTDEHYPFGGYVDDPVNPTMDINFGQYRRVWWNTESQITNNNMFNAYWKNTILELVRNKMLKTKFYLTPVDIEFIRNNLNSRIFYKGQYWVINRVINYNPIRNGLTDVELISYDLDLQIDVDTPVDDDNTIIVDGGNIHFPTNRPNPIDSAKEKKNVFPFKNVVGGGIYPPVTGITSTDDINYSETPYRLPSNSIISGDYNEIINSKNITLLGSTNVTVLNAQDSTILNSKNSVVTGDNVFVFGVDNTEIATGDVFNVYNTLIIEEDQPLEIIGNAILGGCGTNEIRPDVEDSFIVGGCGNIIFPETIRGGIINGLNNSLTSQLVGILGTAPSDSGSLLLGGELNIINESYDDGGLFPDPPANKANNLVLGGRENWIANPSGLIPPSWSENSFILGGSNHLVRQTLNSGIIGGEECFVGNTIFADHTDNDSCGILFSKLALIDDSEKCVVLAGEGTITSSLNSFIGGGFGLITDSNSSTVIGGDGGINSSNNAAIVGGDTNAILNSSTNSIILGGFNNEIDGFTNVVMAGTTNETADRDNCLFADNISLKDLPTAATGLPSGSVWRDGTDLKIVP